MAPRRRDGAPHGDAAELAIEQSLEVEEQERKREDYGDD